MGNDTRSTLCATLEALSQSARRRDISPEIIAEARQATQRCLGVSLRTPLATGTKKRAEAYFSAVVRRRAVRSGQPPRAAARFVVAAVVADLRDSGRDGVAIWEALERGWNDSIPSDVLDEYRLELCG